jgi:hypothetical protein
MTPVARIGAAVQRTPRERCAPDARRRASQGDQGQGRKEGQTRRHAAHVREERIKVARDWPGRANTSAMRCQFVVQGQRLSMEDVAVLRSR